VQQVKFSLEETQIVFLNDHGKYGYKDKSSMVRAALRRLMKELELESLKESADLYAQLYDSDADLRKLTDSATSGWPE
jgi:Arc/MetJ-type ribon-helix-helix transcriptional regulator